MLLRQINSAFPIDSRTVPERISTLSLSQMYLLDELYAMAQNGYETLSLSALTQDLGFSKATISATLKVLRKLGYINMQIDNDDNRRKKIILTERAQEVKPDVQQYVADFNRGICKGISGRELRSFEKTLSMVLQNMRDIRARGP